MKKLLFVVIILAAPALVICQNNFKLNGYFEGGYESRNIKLDIPSIGRLSSLRLQPFYGDIGINVSLKNLKAGISSKTYFNKCSSAYFQPNQIEYRIGISYAIKFMTIGCEHLCSHSVGNDLFYEDYDKIYLKIVIK